MDDIPDVATLISGLEADNDGTRKFAVFKLQTMLSDPEFADAFVQGDGLGPLRRCVLETNGNAQAYALGSLDGLLELDIGWEAADALVIDKAVALAVGHPLVNIVRNALTLLVLIVSRPLSPIEPPRHANIGFRAVKPALSQHPHFLESLVQRLNASDHTLCANALQLVNALMRDAITNGGENEWPKFIKRLQDLGVIGGVGILMRSEAAADPMSPLADAILDFQGLTKILLRKWRMVQVGYELPEHIRAFKTIHLLSRPGPDDPPADDNFDDEEENQRKHPERWRRLGFETENPAQEFEETGYLGMMDLVEFARRNDDVYHKILKEQSLQERSNRCPLARASIGVTLILYDHFEMDDFNEHSPNAPGYERHDSIAANIDRLYRPLLLQWGRLHYAALTAFVRLWRLSGAEAHDFFKIEELVRIAIEHIVGRADRRTEIAKIEEDLRTISLEVARRWQVEGLDEIYSDAWGPHLAQVREQLYNESLQFMKEQRVRCLLKGSWFPAAATLAGLNPKHSTSATAWRYVRLSHNRRWLHYGNYSARGSANEIPLEELREKIDLNTVTSVDSNVSASDPVITGAQDGIADDDDDDEKEDDNASDLPPSRRTAKVLMPSTKITIMGRASGSTAASVFHSDAEESPLLELLPQTPHLASEWLDGLLLLLDQQPITKTTTSLIDMLVDWGVRLRMLNLRWEDVDWEAIEARARGTTAALREVPTREGLDEEYFYAMGE